MSTGVIIAIIVGVILLICLIYFISVFNKINRIDLKCQQALSGIDVALTKRYDLLTKLQATAKQYAHFEKSTILETIKLRKSADVNEQIKANNKLNKAQTQLFAVAENYPDLKTSEVYCKLCDGITNSEEHLQAARRVYNVNVDLLNQYFVTFPNNMIAGSTKKQMRKFFEADDQHKQDVEISYTFE